MAAVLVDARLFRRASDEAIPGPLEIVSRCYYQRSFYVEYIGSIGRTETIWEQHYNRCVLVVCLFAVSHENADVRVSAEFVAFAIPSKKAPSPNAWVWVANQAITSSFRLEDQRKDISRHCKDGEDAGDNIGASLGFNDVRMVLDDDEANRHENA